MKEKVIQSSTNISHVLLCLFFLSLTWIVMMFRWKSVVTCSTFFLKSIPALGLASADSMDQKRSGLHGRNRATKANSLQHCTTSQYEEGLRLCACSFALRECPMLIVFTLQRNGASHCLSLFCHTFCKLCMFIYAFITSWSLMDTGCHVVYWCLTECPFYCFSRLAELKSTAKTLVHTGLFIYVDLKVYVFKGKCIMIKCSYNMETFF